MRAKDETQNDIMGIKLHAIAMSHDTHEIAAIAHMLLHGRPNLVHYDITDMRRWIDRLKVTIGDMDQRMSAVEKDMPTPHRPEYARQMEVA